GSWPAADAGADPDRIQVAGLPDARAETGVQPRGTAGQLPARRRHPGAHRGQPRQQAAQEARSPRHPGRAGQRLGRGLPLRWRVMKATPGLRRQIIQSLAVMALGIIFIAVFGSYVFYAIAVAYMPGSISETWMPSRVEMIWIGCTIVAALGISVFVAIRL